MPRLTRNYSSGDFSEGLFSSDFNRIVEMLFTSPKIIRKDSAFFAPKFSYFFKSKHATPVQTVNFKINSELKRTLKPLVIVSELLGASYFHETPAKRRIYIAIYRVIVLAALILIVVHEVPTIKYWMSQLTSFHSLLAFVEAWSKWIILIINYLLNVKNSRRLAGAVTVLISLPLMFDAPVIRRIYYFQIILILINLFLMSGYLGIGHLVMWKNDNYKWYTFMIYVFAEFHLTLANVQFVGFLYVVREFYKSLNERLKKWNETPVGDFRTSLFTVERREFGSWDLVKFRELHLNLYGISLKLNQCYSLQVLFFIVLSMIEITFSLRSFMLFLVKSEEAEDANDWSQKPWLEVLLTIFWGGYYFSCLIEVLSMCDLTATESKRTSVIVHDLINLIQDKDTERQLQLFSLQLTNHSAAFTAGRFFQLDFAILHSIVGTITTYLVIIITFRE